MLSFMAVCGLYFSRKDMAAETLKPPITQIPEGRI